ncbi:MAG: energy-coupling factor transporter transmembrane protein EcfT [Sneathiellales bacterium]|nr:energy-coupling factor transporter transmembrane protein EcfT [Sneathiellales bacterium]
MISLYHHGNSWLHQRRAGYKLLALVALSTALFYFKSYWPNGIALGVIAGGYFSAGISFSKMIAQIRPVWILLVIIFLAQGWLASWHLGGLVVIRFAALILAASLVTLTTRTSDMIEAIEKTLTPFSRWISIEKVSLALSLAIRFIPVLGDITREVREAQRVRGLEKNIFAIIMPVTIRTLKMADHVAEALDARSFDSQIQEKAKR